MNKQKTPPVSATPAESASAAAGWAADRQGGRRPARERMWAAERRGVGGELLAARQTRMQTEDQACAAAPFCSIHTCCQGGAAAWAVSTAAA